MMSSRGLATNAMPRPSCCCSPPNRFPAIWCQRSLRRGNNSRTRVRAGVDLGGVLLGEQPRRRLEVLGDGERGEHCSAPRHLHDPQSGALDRIGVGDVSTVEDDRALDRSTRPETAFNSVDFPAPLVPRRATISPWRISMSTPNRTRTLS